MAFDGNGNYNLPVPEFPAVAGEYILATDFNTIMQDIATALSKCLVEDGQQPLTANLPAGNRKITNLAAGTVAGDALRFEQIGIAAGNVLQADQAITVTTRAATTTLATTLKHTLSDTSATITAFNGTAGVTFHCRALGAGSITHHATDLIITQTGASITTAVGDTFEVQMLTGTTARIVNYVRASGMAVISTGATFTGLVNLAAGADIASASTIDLTAATGNCPRITGTTPTSAVTMNTGQQMVVVADGAWPLTYHATTNKLNIGSNYTCTAGDLISYSKDLSGVVHGVIHRATGSKSLAFTRDLTAASGDVSYTGFGLTPKTLVVQALVSDSLIISSGSCTETDERCAFFYGSTWNNSATAIIYLVPSAGNAQGAIFKSSSPGEVTLTWTKSGSPTGTADIHITAFS